MHTDFTRRRCFARRPYRAATAAHTVEVNVVNISTIIL